MFVSEKTLWFGLRCCLYCGSLDRGTDGLCSVCSQDLWSWQHPGLFRQEIHKLKISSLFHWLPGQQEVLSRLIRALKGSGNDKLWCVYAEAFLRQNLLEVGNSRPKQILLVPAPSRHREKDHAFCFTQALVHEGVGLELYNCLARPQATGVQKKRSRSQREKVTLEWAENFTLKEFRARSAGKHIVFVDDVVTTGATARAAWQALDRPRDFAVWALAQRGLSCGASRDLL